MEIEFKDRLAELMQEYHFTKRRLAKAAGVSYSTIVQYCAGDRSPTTKRKEVLAEIFNCDIDYLMGRTNVKRVADLEKALDDRFTNKDVELLAAFRDADEPIKTVILILLGLKKAK